MKYYNRFDKIVKASRKCGEFGRKYFYFIIKNRGFDGDSR